MEYLFTQCNIKFSAAYIDTNIDDGFDLQEDLDSGISDDEDLQFSYSNTTSVSDEEDIEDSHVAVDSHGILG